MASLGAAEELSDDQTIHQISTNLLAPIQLIPAAVPHLRAQGEETNYRFVQLWRPGGTSACRCITRASGAWTNFRFGELNWATGRMALGS